MQARSLGIAGKESKIGILDTQLKFLGRNDLKKCGQRRPKSFGYRSAQPKYFGSKNLGRPDPNILVHHNPNSLVNTTKTIWVATTQTIWFTTTQTIWVATALAIWVATTQAIW